ncbi:MAG TPA: C45 family peptidase [Polyangiaceae bacterium]|nr:C45 family peptidase [Polyangiaceae bacterium]
MIGFLRRLVPKLAVGVLFAGMSTLLAHNVVTRACKIEPRAVDVPAQSKLELSPGVRRFGASFVVQHPGMLEVHLRGSPEQIGFSHARLLQPEMRENEGILLGHFQDSVPSFLLRRLILDVAQVRYRHVDLGMGEDRQREIAASALGFEPDPFRTMFPTYQRFVYLNALYDIALSFEHSPLIGCTTFVFSGAQIGHSGSLLARNFDFEVDPIFDRKKAVFFVRENGKLPFASVAWPGLVGVVSGINVEGVAVVVHGGRAGEPRAEGRPVVHTLREVLGRAHDTSEAIRILGEASPLVSHIIVLTDRQGHAVRVERVPGAPNFVQALGDAAAVTNHLEGPHQADPKNQRVRASTSTLPRRERGDELVRNAARPVTPETLASMLRDRKGVGGKDLKLGDRNAIDALIATHGVIMDTEGRKLWVSVAPHLLNRFVAFDLERRLAANYEPEPSIELPSIPPDADWGRVTASFPEDSAVSAP